MKRSMTIASSATAALITLALFGTPAPIDAQIVNVREQGVPDYHSVVKGDTLWDLSARYYGDSYDWPTMWSYNPHITNPHWIYPGDIIYLKPRSGIVQQPKGQGPKKLMRDSLDPNALKLYLATGGFALQDEEPEFVGRIIASPKEATMLGELDQAYVGFGDDAYTDEEKDEIDAEDRSGMRESGKVKAGDVFAILRKAGSISNSEGDSIGDKYYVLGSLRVTEVSDKYLEKAEIIQSWIEIERGDLLVRYDRQLKVVSPTKSNKDMVARVADSLFPRSVLGEFHYVLIDRGAEDGVRIGNRLYVYQRGDGMQRLKAEFHVAASQDNMPWERVGQVMVIDTKKRYSTAVVIDSKRELISGDRLEMYKGY